jgi:hypothetical protein
MAFDDVLFALLAIRGALRQFICVPLHANRRFVYADGG